MLKKKFLPLFVFSALVQIFLAEPCAQLSDPLEWLHPDSVVGSVPAPGTIDVPGNGVAEMNVLFNGLDTAVPLSFVCSENGGEWFRLVDIPVPYNTGLDGNCEWSPRQQGKNPYVTRKAPFRVFDAMEPLSDEAVAPSSETTAMRVRFRRPATIGGRTIRLSFTQGSFRTNLEFRVNVHTVKVPPVGKDSFKYTNWVNYKSVADSHGLEMWSPEHWQMIARYVRLAVYGRQNSVMLPWIEQGDGLDDGKYGRLVDLLTNEGVYYLEGPHLCGFRNDWFSKDFVPHGNTNLTTTAAGAAIVARHASNFADLIGRHGWRDRWYQHVADEASSNNVINYRITCGIVRKYMPGIRLLDAVELPDMAGALDAYCPKNYRYEESRAEYEALRARPGDEIWCYTCCFPGGIWLNRMLDQELLRPVYLGWGCHLFNLDGYLHWGFNQFSPKTDPLKAALGHGEAKVDTHLPAGDRNIVYAGADGPWPSVRLEAMRQGMEDLELLRLLCKKSPEKAQALVRRVVRGFGDYSAEIPLYRAVRHDLLRSLDE